MVTNRVTEMLGVERPIVQAPMGWIARSQLASAVCNAGGLGIIETSSGELDAIKGEIRVMRELTDRPFGVNIAQAFVRDPSIAQFVVDQGVTFVTTSAGDPNKYTRILKDNGLTVFHVVPTLAAALKAVDAGVDGLVVEASRAAVSRTPRVHPPWCYCRWCARTWTYPLSLRAVSATARRWLPRSRSAPRAYKWAPG
ncbi:Nitronate monooxygenase [Mycobacteroides salmoniphilum]|nr:Nitronate monooxygenase [Mycobacteroides salmoniphilum]TDZ84441.1 Nitronate monooxygenase [Mycobacteroides salmoniphilum]